MPTTTNTTGTTKARRQTTKATPAAPSTEETTKVEPTEDKPKRETISAKAQFDRVKDAVEKAGDAGTSLADLAKATGLTYRQVHNVTWRMEGSPKDGELKKPDERILRRINEDSRVRYAMRKPGDSANMAGRFATTGKES